jgi:DNA gyrase subunit A
MVVTMTRGGYIKRTKSDSIAVNTAAAKVFAGAQLRSDDVVEHFFVTTTHRWLLFFTNTGRVYRAKAYEVQEAGRDAKGQHVANLLALQPGRRNCPDSRHRQLRSGQYLGSSHPAGHGEEDRTNRNTTPTGPAELSLST